MAIHRQQNLRNVDSILLQNRLSNQLAISGTNESIILTKGIFFLELLIIETGKTVTIKDGDGRTIATSLTSFSQDYSPLRCDHGIQFTGDVILAKGFVVEDAFQ